MEEDLTKLSGEENVKQRPRYILPVVRLNGKEGIFYKFEKDEEGNIEKIDLGDRLQGTILKVRRTFVGWGKDYSLFTNEHNSWKDKMTLFERREGEVNMIDTGTSAELRPKYPELKMTQVLYLLLEPQKEVVKLLVKGKGLQNLFDFWDEFKSDEHIYQYLLEIRADKEVGKLGEYYYTTFARLREVDDMNLIADKIREVANKIAEVESYYEVPPVSPEIIEEPEQSKIEFKEKETEEVKYIDKEGFPIYGPKKEEDVDPEDIPF
uniref:Uncharacterized protein n=1 Tax=candidate division CPR3 bacterium TaxID=2268181 RepID=A0A7V3JAB3_UNCC3